MTKDKYYCPKSCEINDCSFKKSVCVELESNPELGRVYPFCPLYLNNNSVREMLRKSKIEN
jgi:hypothetical protein